MNERGPASILLVEDNPQNVYLTRVAFEQTEVAHTLYVARDGDEALCFLRREAGHATAPRPDLILLDLNMPGIDGRDVLRAIKADGKLRRIPVVVLTTSSSPADLELTYDLHVNGYLTKPIGLAEWRDLVRGVEHFWLRLNYAAPAA